MTEQPEQQRETVRTGVPAVDEVIEAVDALDPNDVATHVAVFEQAHDQLRRALDASADPA